MKNLFFWSCVLPSCSLVLVLASVEALADPVALDDLSLEERVWAGECSGVGRPGGPLGNEECEPLRSVPASLVLEPDLGPFPVVDLKPYFADDHPFHEARRLKEGKKCGEALALVDKAREACGETCGGRQAIDRLRAETLWCSGSRKEGYEAMKALDAEGYPGMKVEVRETLRSYARVLRVKDVPESLPPSLSEGADRYLQGQIRVAKKRASGGDLEGAIALLQRVQREVRGGWQVRKAATAEGSLLEKAGRYDEAAQVYYRIWATSGSKARASMEKRLDKLAKKGVASYQLSRGEKLDEASPALAKLTRRKRGRAVKALGRALKLRPRDRDALGSYALGLHLERERERERALKAFQRAERQVLDAELRTRILFARGTALRRLNQDREAIEVYQSIARTSPRDPLAAESLYQAGRLLVYLGDYAEAKEVLARFALLYSDAQRAPDAYWQAAWASWLGGDTEGAHRLLTYLVEHHGQKTDRSELTYELKGLYWSARALARMGRTAEAIDGFRFVMERFPLTWYAALSHHQIEAIGDNATSVPFASGLKEPITNAFLKDLGRCEVPGHPRARRGLELWKTGRKREARQALLSQLQFQNVPRGVVEILSTFQFQSDDVSHSHWVAKRYADFGVAPYEGNARLWGLAYPVPDAFFEEVQKVGSEVDVNPYFPLAIMRHESSFKPSAGSRVGAIGLMQLMPGTARSIQKIWYQKSGPSKKQLRQPATNIRLGTTMLRMLTDYYQGNLPLAVASYNAGVGHGDRWWRASKGLATDELVEQITYPGTVAYLKKVLGSYYAYRVIYGDGSPPPIPLMAPEELGTWGAPADSGLVGSR